MKPKIRKQRRNLRMRKRYNMWVSRWERYGCSCGEHNMRSMKPLYK